MPSMAAEFNLTADQKAWVFSAFTIAYAAFEIPSGWLGDRFGARLALTRIVLWWSAFTALTGAALGFRSLLPSGFFSARAKPAPSRTSRGRFRDGSRSASRDGR